MTETDASRTEQAPKDDGTTKVVETARPEVSAQTITRMMGIPTTTDIKLLEGKIELLSTKLNGITAKVERILTVLNSMPSAGDIDRMELQMGAIKALVREVVDVLASGAKDESTSEAAAAAEQSRKIRAGIRSSTQDVNE